MKRKAIILLTVALIAPLFSIAQYVHGLYDYDSTYDWGWNIFIKSDNTFFIKGGSKYPAIGNWAISNITVSADGSTLLNKHILQNSNANLYGGSAGETKQIPGGGYLLPMTIQWPNATTGYLYSAAGMVKLDGAGDTVFVKTYTDTSVQFDNMLTCAVMPDGGFLIGGDRSTNTGSVFPGFLVRANNIGDTIWTHTYQKYATQQVMVNTVAPLAGGRILVGAMSSPQVTTGAYTYLLNVPWFLVLDSMGNIIRDTIYGTRFVGGGGVIYPDAYGGYFHIGSFDSLYTTYPNDIENFPGYISHLDTDFNIEWITSFPYSLANGHRYQVKAIQLHDGNFLIEGDIAKNTQPVVAWAAKIDRTGAVVWDRSYTADPAHDAYFRDVVEKPNGNLVFVGAAFSDTLPAWHYHQDMWLLEVDSNGCVVAGCSPTAIATPALPDADIKISPNPTYGPFVVNAPQQGTLLVCDLQGREVANYPIQPGENVLQLPASLSAGMYICKFVSKDNNIPVVLRLVYQP